MNNYTYITNFHKSRDKKIGASDIPMLIPSPNRPIESLAAWTNNGKRQHRTALDLYNEKLTPPPYEYNYSADMGHYMEGKILYEFIKDNISKEIAVEFFRGYQLHKIEQQKAEFGKVINPEPFNTTPFKHNTETSNYYGVAHGDCLYDPEYMFSKFMFFKKMKKSFKNIPMEKDKNGHWILDAKGFKINLSKPFLIEAKSATKESAGTRKFDQYKGYDLTLKKWQGVPLKVYFQCQFQMLLYDVDICYLALGYNTSEKHYWQIDKNIDHQKDLIQLATYMKKCIDEENPPKELVMNSKDIQSLYPELKEDFKEITNDELIEVMEIAKEYYIAKKKEKKWKNEKEDCEHRISIHLKDTEFIKGVVNESVTDIAKWKTTAGSDRVVGLKEIREREDGETLLKYMNKKGLIKRSESSRKPSIIIKEKELEV